jgi:anti-anti-sigma factor
MLDGELTEDTLGSFRQAVSHQLDNDEVIDIVLNMEKTQFVDSAALEYLLDLEEILAGRLGQVKLLNPNEFIQKIFEVTRLNGEFQTVSDVNEAIQVTQV